ncbi:hypothetical protein L6164_035958 [Bauhinia variegata]|uniref:Uncharacterized protein n=1 Tax=Bauhinia variegata TaxID=167791 RepID=A0ACB9KFN7_BAUVA|nr:hypothetical protein L6164_035958 [Bauhinia variegata]
MFHRISYLSNLVLLYHGTEKVVGETKKAIIWLQRWAVFGILHCAFHSFYFLLLLLKIKTKHNVRLLPVTYNFSNAFKKHFLELKMQKNHRADVDQRGSCMH